MKSRPLVHCSLGILTLIVWGLIETHPADAQQHTLLVSSFDTSEVLRFNGDTGGFIDTFVDIDNGTDGIAIGPDGNLYVGNFYNNKILRFDRTTGTLLGEFVSAGSGGLDWPEKLLFGPDGTLYVASRHNNSIMRYNGTTGAPLPSSGNTGAVFVPSNSGGLSEPFDLLFGLDGNLLVSSRNTNNILRFNKTTGAFMGEFVPAGSGGLTFPLGMVLGRDHNLYITSRTEQILRFNGITGAFDRVFASRTGSFPTGLAFGWDGNLYMSDDHNNYVVRFNASTGAYIDDFIPAGTGSNLTFMLFPGLILDALSNQLIWQNTVTGDVSVWYMSGPTWSRNWDYLGKGIPTQWKIVGMADLNGDSKSDILWQNTVTGDITYWLMDGIKTIDTGFIATSIPTQWKIIGVADINGDEKADFIWQNTQTGDVTVWYMNGATWTGNWSYIARGIPLAWQIAPKG